MKKRARLLLLALIGIAALLCASVLFAVLGTRRNTEAQLREFQRLSVSNDPTAEFDAFRQQSGSEVRALGCDESGCQFETRAISNEFLAWLHIVPYTEMKTYFVTTVGGVLQTAMLDYRVAPSGKRGAIVHIQQGLCRHGCGVSFDVNPHGRSEQNWNGLVEFDLKATGEQRRAALSPDLSCFARIGGCKDVAELLPTMWTRVERTTVMSRLRGFSQQAEECHCVPSAEDFF